VAEVLQRQEHDRACKDKKRKLETRQRQKHDRACKDKKRKSETTAETRQRREKNQTYMAKTRALVVPMEKYISNFHSKIKQGPEFVCTCCHRLMYKQTVIPYTRSKYTKASNELLDQVFSTEYNYTSSDGQQWTCKT
jgi:hypothetical protein